MIISGNEQSGRLSSVNHQQLLSWKITTTTTSRTTTISRTTTTTPILITTTSRITTPILITTTTTSRITPPSWKPPRPEPSLCKSREPKQSGVYKTPAWQKTLAGSGTEKVGKLIMIFKCDPEKVLTVTFLQVRSSVFFWKSNRLCYIFWFHLHHRIRMETEAKANNRRCFLEENGRPLGLCSRRIDKGQYYRNNCFDSTVSVNLVVYCRVW